jgi:hypothetical protein
MFMTTVRFLLNLFLGLEENIIIVPTKVDYNYLGDNGIWLLKYNCNCTICTFETRTQPRHLLTQLTKTEQGQG